MQWKRGGLIRLPLFCQSRASASFSGKRAMLLLFNEPRYNQSPYSRALVIGE